MSELAESKNRPVATNFQFLKILATSGLLLFKVQLPLALPTIMAGVNQTIMMALSMVVIAAMISAGGLGEIVLKGITQMKIGLGFEGGIAVVILAIVLDRITQGFVRRK